MNRPGSASTIQSRNLQTHQHYSSLEWPLLQNAFSSSACFQGAVADVLWRLSKLARRLPWPRRRLARPRSQAKFEAGGGFEMKCLTHAESCRRLRIGRKRHAARPFSCTIMPRIALIAAFLPLTSHISCRDSPSPPIRRPSPTMATTATNRAASPSRTPSS